jgi:hypothetical protein
MKHAEKLKIALVLFFVILLPPVFAAEPTHDPLFHIERNKNANIVQYDALVDQNGNLYAKEPIEAYWVRLADDGKTKELTWVQKKFAYGFKVDLNKQDNSATVDMVANIGRSLVVKHNGEDYRAVANINSVESFITRIFIQASGSGTSTKVEYIEMYGSAVSNQEEQYERIIP